MHRTRPLDAVELRVLGGLLEKEQTTPEAYPLTINQVIAACNQKSNREPVVALTETEVVEALDRLGADVLAWRSVGARAERWEHRLDRRWNLDSARKAVMTLLLLRGPQTPGELRTRSGRMHSFGSVADVERVLQGLAEGTDPLVRELPRQPGQRERRWMHVAGGDEPEAELAAAPEAPIAPRPSGPSVADRLGRLEAEVSRLSQAVDALSARLPGIEESP